MLRYSSKEDINAFINAISGKLQSMCIHQMASVVLEWLCDDQHVIEYLYEEILTPRQSFILFEELYHRQYVNVKDTESQNVKDIVKKNPLLKEKIIGNLFVVITKLVSMRVSHHR